VAPANAKPVPSTDGDALLAKLEEALGGLPGSSPGYVYVDDQGRRVEVANLDDVPPKLRAYAVPLSKAGAGHVPSQPDRVFKYKNQQGREVFTNVSESVPLEQRAQAELDLSHVPLNSEVGTQINARLSAEHRKLSDSPYCQEALREAEEHRLEDLWHEYGPLFVVGAVILLFLLASPMMMKRVAVPDWVRTLRFVVPAERAEGGGEEARHHHGVVVRPPQDVLATAQRVGQADDRALRVAGGQAGLRP